MGLTKREKEKVGQNNSENNVFINQLNNYFSGTMQCHEYINVCSTPNILKVLNSSARKVILTQKELKNAVGLGRKGDKSHTEGHDIDKSEIYKLPDSIRNPILVLKGNNPKAGIVVLLTELKDKKNNNVLVPIALDRQKGKVSDIATIYGRKNIEQYLSSHLKDIIAVNMEKAGMYANMGSQFLQSLDDTVIRFDNSIAYSLANVKYPEEKNLQENQNDKGDVSPMTEQQMLAQIEALRKEFEGKFSAMEEKFNNLSSEVQTINKFVAAMTEAQGFEQTMSEIESVTKQLTACENAVFYCYDNGADKFFSGSGDERNYEQAADNIRAAFDSREIISSGQSAVIPLVSAKGETLGVIAAEKEGGFTAADYDYFKSGSQITGTVELALNKEFEHQGRVTDELTGLKNRQGLNEYVAGTVRRNINADKPVNIVMCDIDHFKNINDTYGHDAGDTVLRNVAKILQDGTRSGSDCAFRMGGEEMVLMLNCEPEKAAEIAERLRSEVESAVHTVMQDGQEKEISVTISMGVHQMKPETEMTKENARAVFDSEFKSADDLVYEAKESGRNRVVTDISETVIELDGYISDDIPVYDIDTDKDISDEILQSGSTEKTENETPQIKRYTPEQIEQVRNVDLADFVRFCGLECKKEGKNIKVVDYGGMYINPENNTFYWASHNQGGEGVLDFCQKVWGMKLKDTMEMLAGKSKNPIQYIDGIYNDFLSNTENTNSLPLSLNSAENRTIVSEYINNQLDSGNISESQRETLIELRQEIRDYEENLFCDVVDEIMEQAAEISEISRETREQEQEKSQENER